MEIKCPSIFIYLFLAKNRYQASSLLALQRALNCVFSIVQHLWPFPSIEFSDLIPTHFYLKKSYEGRGFLDFIH